MDPIKNIEEKLELIATDLLGSNYTVESFDSFIFDKSLATDLQQFLENNSVSKLDEVISDFKLTASKPDTHEGGARLTEDLLKEVDLIKYPVFKQHSIFENLKVEQVEEPLEFNTNPQAEIDSNQGNSSQDDKGPGAENGIDISGDLSSISIGDEDDTNRVENKELSSEQSSVKTDPQIAQTDGTQTRQDMEELRNDIEVAGVPKLQNDEDSEPSVDNIELTVDTIQTENLQIMKEKPTVNLIK